MQWLLDGNGKSPALLDSEFAPYPTIDNGIAPLLAQENTIQKEVDFFKTNNPNAIVIMVSDDTMEPVYSSGDFVGGIQYRDAQTETDEPVIFAKNILTATPIIWHRWKFKNKEAI